MKMKLNHGKSAIILKKKYQRYGYTTEAMKAILSFAKAELQLKEIVGRYAKENPASGNVMRKLWVQYEKDIPYECNEGIIHMGGV